jgi:hypothetical protein
VEFWLQAVEPGVDCAGRETFETLGVSFIDVQHLADEVHDRLYPASEKLVAVLPWPEPDLRQLAADGVITAMQMMSKQQVISTRRRTSRLARSLAWQRWSRM